MTNNYWPACKGFAHQAAIRNQLNENNEPLPALSGYPETVNLAFNFSSIKAGFQFHPTTTDAIPEDSFWVIFQGSNTVLHESAQGLKLLQGPLPEWIIHKHPPLCIGSWQGKPLYAVTIDKDLALMSPFVVDDYNATDDRVDIQTLSLAGMAKQVLHWERQSQYCQRCGAKTERLEASWGTCCRSCKAHHFPHIHPCAIVLVKRGNELLLTRKAEWVPGRYSLVAGFLDFGESLEECAIREVKEETGIDILNVRYVGSQNWPFPAQLMAGFVAEYAGGEISVDHNELEDARWFPVDALPLLPGKRSIARWIIDTFK
jgi:NAD+ diphosphatase